MNDCNEARRRYPITMACCPICMESLPDAIEIKGEHWSVCCHIAGELKKMETGVSVKDSGRSISEDFVILPKRRMP